MTNQSDERQPLLLRGEEVADALGISRALAYRLMQNGTLPTVRVSRSVRCPRAALLEFVAVNTRQSGAAAAQPKGSEHLNPPADKPAKARGGKARDAKAA
jgi:excisionase family DNA binding protein